MQQLERDVAMAMVDGNVYELYRAYLRRAVVRMLYTSGLRNFELRKLKLESLNIPEGC